RFQTDAGIEFTFIRIGVATEPFIHFQITMRMLTGITASCIQAGSGFLEVIINGCKSARCDLLCWLPARNMLFLRKHCPVWPVIRDQRHEGAGCMGTDIIADDQGMLIIRMIKPVINALMLHQAAKESKIAFLVLHAVFPLAIVTT